jgi:uncharacterized protein YjbI with pentapeptide repeats
MGTMDAVKATGWNAIWAHRGQPWRTEPEIGEERQAELAARLTTPADAVLGTFPFGGVRLERADVEWLLAVHEDRRGPVDPGDESQRERVGLDLRGADLSHIDLSGLPLARTACDPARPGIWDLTEGQRRAAAVNLHGAHLVETHLEGACLDYADMARADMRGCRLEGASLWGVSLREANCDGAHFERADLWNAHLEGAFLYRVYFQGAMLHEAYLAGAHVTDLYPTDEEGVGPMLADIHWEGVNLSVVNWSVIRELGDDRRALEPEQYGWTFDRSMRIRMLKSAARANQQLALALQAQGMTDDAGRFFYRSKVLERKLLALKGRRQTAPYLFSLLLEALTGYGYRMGRMIVAYVALIALFAALYYGLNQGGATHFGVREAVVLSITAFHGRVFATPFTAASPQSLITAAEAITGFLFEGLFIAMLSQRVFGR